MGSIILSLLVSIFAGCNNGEKDNDVKKKGSKEPITFTVFSKDVNGNYENWTSDVAKELTKRTG